MPGGKDSPILLRLWTGWRDDFEMYALRQSRVGKRAGKLASEVRAMLPGEDRASLFTVRHDTCERPVISESSPSDEPALQITPVPGNISENLGKETVERAQSVGELPLLENLVCLSEIEPVEGTSFPQDTEPSIPPDVPFAIPPPPEFEEKGAVGALARVSRRPRSEFPSNFIDRRYYITVILLGNPVWALVDSGAARSYVGAETASLIEPRVDGSFAGEMRMADGHTDRVTGEAVVDIEIDGIRRDLPVRVAPGLDYDCILGIDFMELFAIQINAGNATWRAGLGPTHQFTVPGVLLASSEIRADCMALAELTPRQRESLEAHLDRVIPPASVKPGVTSLISHSIDVQGSTPIRQRARRISPKMLSVAHEEVDRMLREGIIERSSSAWASCPVIIPKPNGKYRFCIDYREVNAVTRKDAYPIPHMDSILDKLRMAHYISKLDLSQAYFQIPLEEASKEITAFIVPGKGLFQFRRMPFGLTNAPATFQRLVDRLIGPELEPHVFAYLDDIIIVNETFEEHLEWLDRVLKIILAAGLEINREKSEFCCSEVRYLGYLINNRGLEADPEKIAPILSYPAPTNLKQLRRFLGMVGWYARFLPNHATDKIPLVELLRKDVRWHWGPEQQQAFQRLKESLSTSPVLSRPDFSLPFTLQTDASEYAIGAVLTQVQDDGEHPIVFVNRVLTAAERKYSVTKKECLAVIWAIKKLRPYLEGYSFTVITDHSSLRWLHHLKDPTGRLARWALSLQQYPIQIVHRKGALHHVPDALSRAVPSELQVEESGDDDDLLAVVDETEDPWYQGRVENVTKFPQSYPDWRIENGHLYCHRPNPQVELIGDDLEAWKLVLPCEKRGEAIRRAHSQPSTGHLGIEKTYQLVSRKFYWPGIFKEVTAFVRSCPECQQHKTPVGSPVGLLGRRIPEGPWTTVSGDVMGPFPPSKSQHRYIVVFMDTFTKWVECQALRKANAQSIVRAFEDLIVYRWGAPEIFLTDNGTEFSNRLVTSFTEAHGIRQITIPPYHAQANPVERVNRIIKGMISTFVGKEHRDWDLHLHEFRFAINNSFQASTKETPAMLNLGRTLRGAKDLRRELEGSAELVSAALEDWSSRVNRLTLMHDVVRDHLERAHKRQASYYNRGRREIRYAVGELVWRKNRVLSSAADGFAAKLAPKFVGPAQVTRVLSPVVYEVKDIEGTVVKTHISDLKPFVPVLSADLSTLPESPPPATRSRERRRRKMKNQQPRPPVGDTSVEGSWSNRLRSRAK